MGTNLVIPGGPLDRLCDEMVTTRLVEGECILASGIVANNHLDIGGDEVTEAQKLQIVTGLQTLSVLAGVTEIHAIASVPSGADPYVLGMTHANRFSDRYAAPLLFEKQPDERRKFHTPPMTQSTIESLQKRHGRPKVIVVDDASHDGGTSEAMADYLSESGLQVDLVMSVFFRGDIDALRQNSKYMRAILMAKYISPQIDWLEFRRTKEITEARIAHS